MVFISKMSAVRELKKSANGIDMGIIRSRLINQYLLSSYPIMLQGVDDGKAKPPPLRVDLHSFAVFRIGANTSYKKTKMKNATTVDRIIIGIRFFMIELHPLLMS